MTNNNLADKEGLRQSLPCPDLSANNYGKLAEQVRRSRYWAEAKQIFVEPVPSLLQVRINAILDQKELVLPSGGLKEGFFLMKPNTIPCNKLAHALTFKGMGEFGEKMPSSMLSSLRLDFAVIDSEAVDVSGGRIGDGLGFTDICVALFNEYGALEKGVKIVAVTPENRVLPDPLPADPWDICLDGYATETEVVYVPRIHDLPKIIWSVLPKKRIRKIQPLWDLFCTENPLPA